MTDREARGRIIRDDLSGHELLDNDGDFITEVDAENVDEAFIDTNSSLQQLAAGQRAWRFGHVIVDEAQDLTPMQWRMIARRARGGSMTLVGDLAQRSIGTPGTWRDHLPESVVDFDYRELTVNYRTPSEISPLAAAVLSELAPGLIAPESIRSSGHAPRVVQVDNITEDLPAAVEVARTEVGDGRLAVIGAEDHETGPSVPGVTWLAPWNAKGLEFDGVVLVEPSRFLDSAHGLSLLYVALTRSTNRITIVHQAALPEVLAAVI